MLRRLLQRAAFAALAALGISSALPSALPVLFSFQSSACTPPSVVQVGTPVFFGGFASSSPSVTLNITGVSVNDTILVAISGAGQATSPTYTVADAQGAYTQDAQAPVIASTFSSSSPTVKQQSEIWRLYGATSGTHAITVTNSAGPFNAYGGAVPIEVRGLANAGPVFAVSNSSLGTPNSPAGGSVTPATSCGLAITTASLSSASSSEAFGHPPSGYTSAFINTNGTGITNGQVGSVDYEVINSTSAINPNYATFTAANSWTAATAVYKAPGSGGGGGGGGGSLAIKWHPGHYGDSNIFTWTNNAGTSNSSNGVRIANEIPLIRAGPSQVLGIEAYYFWCVFECTTLGSYNFTALDNDYKAITGYVSGSLGSAVYSSPRRLGIYMLQTDFFHADPTTQGIAPNYILQNPGTYGAGPSGGSCSGVGLSGTSCGGYYTVTGAHGGGTGSGIAFWRPAVMNRWIALMQALAAHPLPDGYTVDTSPYIEWVKPYLETSDGPENSTQAGNPPDSTYTESGYITQLEALNTAMAAAFPHTSYASPANFTGTGTLPFEVSFSNSMPSVRSGESGPDIFGFSSGQNTCLGLCGLTPGQTAYIGLLPPTSGANIPYAGGWTSGGIDKRGVIPELATVENTETIGFVDGAYFTPSDLFQQADTTLHATHIAWSMTMSADLAGYMPTPTCASSSSCLWLGTASSLATWNAATSGGVLAQIVNAPITHTACPTSYPNGCNPLAVLPLFLLRRKRRAANDDSFEQKVAA